MLCKQQSVAWGGIAAAQVVHGHVVLGSGSQAHMERHCRAVEWDLMISMLDMSVL